MMYKKKKGFSLAELLISLLIISIILAAAIPTVTKRNKYDPEHIWMWSGKDSNNSAYFGMGANQSAVIGYYTIPDIEPEDYYHGNVDKEKLLSAKPCHPLFGGCPETKTSAGFTTVGDKLALIKRFTLGNGVENHMYNSHISFYNIDGSTASTTNNVKYAGRIASDEYNLAFGIGTLGSSNAISPSYKGYNTAIGHYSLLFDENGEYNTGLGFNSLKNIVSGRNNTAVGVNTLAVNYGKTDGNGSGSHNTAVGANALLNVIDGIGNTALGSDACNSVNGDYNICIGYGAVPTQFQEDATGTATNPKDNYALVIGNSNGKSVPLVQGHTAKTTTADKELIVNALKFEVRPYDGYVPMMQVIASSGKAPLEFTPGESSSDGYTESTAKFGLFNFTLKDTFGAKDKDGSIRLQIAGIYNEDLETKEARIDAVDYHNPTDKTRYSDIFMNSTFRFVTPQSTDKSKEEVYSKIDVYNPQAGTDKTNAYLKLADALTLQEKSISNVDMVMTKDAGFKLSSYSSGSEKYSLSLKADTGMIFSDGSDVPKTLTFKVDSTVSIPTIQASTEKIGFGNPTYPGVIIHTSESHKNGDIEANALNYVSTFNSYKLTTTGSLYELLENLVTKIPTYVDDRIRSAVQTSDIRLKDVSGDSTAGLKEINALEVKNYTYKDDKEKTPHVGVIAQQIQKIFPNSVIKGEDGYLRIRTEEIFYAMVNSIKELFAQIQDLTAKIVGLDKRLTELEKENAMLKKQNEDFEKRLSKLEAKMAK